MSGGLATPSIPGTERLRAADYRRASALLLHCFKQDEQGVLTLLVEAKHARREAGLTLAVIDALCALHSDTGRFHGALDDLLLTMAALEPGSAQR